MAHLVEERLYQVGFLRYLYVSGRLGGCYGCRGVCWCCIMMCLRDHFRPLVLVFAVIPVLEGWGVDAGRRGLAQGRTQQPPRLPGWRSACATVQLHLHTHGGLLFRTHSPRPPGARPRGRLGARTLCRHLRRGFSLPGLSRSHARRPPRQPSHPTASQIVHKRCSSTPPEDFMYSQTRSGGGGVDVMIMITAAG